MPESFARSFRSNPLAGGSRHNRRLLADDPDLGVNPAFPRADQGASPFLGQRVWSER